jgi:hypothetical protein
MTGKISNVHPIRPPAALPSMDETLAVLGSPIDPRHIKTRTQKSKNGTFNLDYVPWAVLTKCLHARVPGWTWQLLEVKTIGDYVMVSGRLTVPAGTKTLTYEAVSSEPLNGSGAPPIETAASSCLRRACALSGLGLDLWLDH